jgi:hypothetical protein
MTVFARFLLEFLLELERTEAEVEFELEFEYIDAEGWPWPSLAVSAGNSEAGLLD